MDAGSIQTFASPEELQAYDKTLPHIRGQQTFIMVKHENPPGIPDTMVRVMPQPDGTLAVPDKNGPLYAKLIETPDDKGRPSWGSLEGLPVAPQVQEIARTKTIPSKAIMSDGQSFDASALSWEPAQIAPNANFGAPKIDGRKPAP